MPLAAGVLELADELLLLRVDADRRLPGSDRRSDRVVDVPKLRVAVGMLLAFQRLARRLQAVAELAQKPRHRPEPDRVPALGELVGQLARALGRPQKNPFGITAGVALDQLAQHLQQLRIAGLHRRSPRAARPHPPGLKRRLIKLAQPLADRVLRQPTRPRRRRDPPVAERTRLAGGKRSPLTLVQLRAQQPVTLRDRCLSITHAPPLLPPHPTSCT